MIWKSPRVDGGCKPVPIKATGSLCGRRISSIERLTADIIMMMRTNIKVTSTHSQCDVGTLYSLVVNKHLLCERLGRATAA